VAAALLGQGVDPHVRCENSCLGCFEVAAQPEELAMQSRSSAEPFRNRFGLRSAIALAAGFVSICGEPAPAQAIDFGPYGPTRGAQDNIKRSQSILNSRGPGPGPDAFTGRPVQPPQQDLWPGVSLEKRKAIEEHEAILQQRARIDEVLAAKLAPEEQALRACWNLFEATYKAAADGTSVAFMTSFPSGSSPTVGPFFSRGASYLQVRNVSNTQTFSQPLPADGKDMANGFTFKGSVTFRGTTYRTGSDAEGWTEWKDIPHANRQFAVCYYQIRYGKVIISATDQIILLNFWKLHQPPG
jgi:hypothetical protein